MVKRESALARVPLFLGALIAKRGSCATAGSGGKGCRDIRAARARPQTLGTGGMLDASGWDAGGQEKVSGRLCRKHPPLEHIREMHHP